MWQHARAHAARSPSPRPLSFSSLLFLSFFAAGAVLRVLLCWANPPYNAFDDHFEPILMIMKSGVTPAKNACFQCFQPPVFYWLSALIGDAALWAGLPLPHVIKLLQFVASAAGILTLAVCYLILQKFPLSDFAKLACFGTVCFLPRHLYMPAMHSNDSLAYLFAALSVYLAILALERRLSPSSLAALSLVVTLTVFTKYTAFAVLPAISAALFHAYRRSLVATRRRIAIAFLATVVLPSSVLAGLVLGVSGRWSGLFQATPAQSAALSLFPTLLAFNAAGVIALTLRLPVYNAMKPSYFLISTPAFMMFLALGAMLCERHTVIKWTLSILLGALFALAITHVLHIVLSIR